MSIESENAKTEIEEILNNCIHCGLCKSNCPIFKVVKEEKVSPRGQVLILQDKIFDRIVYLCNMCRACEEKCPRNIKLCEAIRKARQVLIEENKITKASKEMLNNLKKYGNIFGKE